MTMTSMSFFRFMAKLEQSGSRISDAWSVELTFSLTVRDWFGNLYTEIKLRILPPILISKFMHL